MTVTNAAQREDVDLAHSVTSGQQPFGILCGLGDQLDIAVDVACGAARLRETAGGCQEGAAHLVAEFAGFLKDVMTERFAISIVDLRCRWRTRESRLLGARRSERRNN